MSFEDLQKAFLLTLTARFLPRISGVFAIIIVLGAISLVMRDRSVYDYDTRRRSIYLIVVASVGTLINQRLIEAILATWGFLAYRILVVLSTIATAILALFALYRGEPLSVFALLAWPLLGYVTFVALAALARIPSKRLAS